MAATPKLTSTSYEVTGNSRSAIVSSLTSLPNSKSVTDANVVSYNVTFKTRTNNNVTETYAIVSLTETTT